MYKGKAGESQASWKRGILGKLQTWVILLVVVFVFYRLLHSGTSGRRGETEDEVVGPDDMAGGDVGQDDAVQAELQAQLPTRRVICNPRQLLCERRRDTLFDGLHKADAQELIHRVMTKMDFKCKNMRRFGNAGDGGYEVCLDKSFIPKKGDCLVYSFGVHDDFSFEEGLNSEFGCEVHSFDPSMGKGDYTHKPNISLHDMGLWGDDFDNENNWKYRRFGTIVEMLNHQKRVIDVLKIDAEGAEWPMLRDIALDPAPFENVKQLIFEAHAPRRKPKNQTMKMTDYAQVFRSMSMLKRLGFRNYFHHDEENSGLCCKWWADLVPPVVHKGDMMICCYEVFLVNMNFL